VSLDRGPGEVAFPGKGGIVRQAAALPEHQLEKIQKTCPLPDAEEFLDVAGVEAVEPLGEEDLVLFFLRKKPLGKPAAEKTAVEVVQLEGVPALRPENGGQKQRDLASRKRVAEFPAGGQRG
jgi:hypothetical protein